MTHFEPHSPGIYTAHVGPFADSEARWLANEIEHSGGEVELIDGTLVVYCSFDVADLHGEVEQAEPCAYCGGVTGCEPGCGIDDDPEPDSWVTLGLSPWR